MIAFSLCLTMLGALWVEATKLNHLKEIIVPIKHWSLVFAAAACSFFPPAYFVFNTPLVPPPIIASLGFLMLTVYIAVCAIVDTRRAVVHAAVTSGLAFPLMLWLTDPSGILTQLGYHDIAGGGMVHVFGGVIALFAVRTQPDGGFHPINSPLGSAVVVIGWIMYIASVSAVLVHDSLVWINGIANLATGAIIGSVAAATCNKWSVHTLATGAIAGIAVTSTDPFALTVFQSGLLALLVGVGAGLLSLNRSSKSFIYGAHIIPGTVGLLAVAGTIPSVTNVVQLTGVATLALVAISAYWVSERACVKLNSV